MRAVKPFTNWYTEKGLATNTDPSHVNKYRNQVRSFATLSSAKQSSGAATRSNRIESEMIFMPTAVNLIRL